MIEYTEEEHFKGLNFNKTPQTFKTYEYCKFEDCNISNFDLSSIKFISFEFLNCDLSNAKIADTFFQECNFDNCKLIGLQFDTCNPFGFENSFTNCQLDHCNFYQMNLTNCSFIESRLKNVDFSEANLSKIKIRNCDLDQAKFEFTKLLNTDLRASYNFNIDPENNQLKGSRFSSQELAGLLLKYGLRID